VSASTHLVGKLAVSVEELTRRRPPQRALRLRARYRSRCSGVVLAHHSRARSRRCSGVILDHRLRARSRSFSRWCSRCAGSRLAHHSRFRLRVCSRAVLAFCSPTTYGIARDIPRVVPASCSPSAYGPDRGVVGRSKSYACRRPSRSGPCRTPPPASCISRAARVTRKDGSV
jgi:hypothetical protein